MARALQRDRYLQLGCPVRFKRCWRHGMLFATAELHMITATLSMYIHTYIYIHIIIYIYIHNCICRPSYNWNILELHFLVWNQWKDTWLNMSSCSALDELARLQHYQNPTLANFMVFGKLQDSCRKSTSFSAGFNQFQHPRLCCWLKTRYVHILQVGYTPFFLQKSGVFQEIPQLQTTYSSGQQF